MVKFKMIITAIFIEIIEFLSLRRHLGWADSVDTEEVGDIGNIASLPADASGGGGVFHQRVSDASSIHVVHRCRRVHRRVHRRCRRVHQSDVQVVV